MTNLKSQRGPGSRMHDVHGNHMIFRHVLSGKSNVADPPALRLLLLELVENQVAQRVKNHALAVAFHRLRDVRMMPHYYAGAGVDGRMRELLLLDAGSALVLHAGVH